jgi:hypothetical protein
MGQKQYGVVSGTMNNGQVFYTPQSHSKLEAIRVSALSLEAAVSTSLTVAVTGPIGSMDAEDKAVLSASYSTLTASIY